MKFSVVIPCYNEKENIRLILERFSEVIEKRSDIEVILVDNGSTDGSDKIIAETAAVVSFCGYSEGRCEPWLWLWHHNGAEIFSR